jgi:D-aminoacyl-tRNA deacylase
VRAVVQRVARASVSVDGAVVGAIGPGLCALVGVSRHDDESGAARLADRLWHLRVFEDEHGKMNRSAAELGRELLVVSQFTLYADTSRGRRPSFVEAAPGDRAEPVVDAVVAALRSLGARVATGTFGEHMELSIVNDGPVTVIVEA